VDVRASDTSNLAAQQVELKRGEPVRERLHGQVHDPFAAHAAAQVDGQVSRPKLSKELRRGKKNDEHTRNQFSVEQESEQSNVSETEIEHHVLDVRV